MALAILAVSGVVGLCFGSFLNVVTTRLAAGEPVFTARSHCPRCRRALAARDLVPLVSSLWLGGRCRRCRAPISWQYPLVEAATALLFVVVMARYVGWPPSVPLTAYSVPFVARDLVLTAGLLALFVLDVRWFIVPDEVTVPLIAFAVVANLSLGLAPLSLLAGAAVGGGFYYLLWAISAGAWVGSGDIRLGVLLGVTLGLRGTLLALYLAYLVGGAVAGALLLTGRGGLKSKLPMGAFLTPAAFVVLVFPDLFNRFTSLF